MTLTNLPRNVLRYEAVVAEGLQKAVASQAKLRTINSEIDIVVVLVDGDNTNIASLVDGVDMILDGTDNFETRFLLNDAAQKFNLPWVYGGCIGAEGQTMTIIPGDTPCLRCLMHEAPPPGTTATCDSAGIIGPIVNIIASVQACEALKILSGNRDAISRVLSVFEIWDNRLRQVKLDSLKDSVDCPTCNGKESPWLDGNRVTHTAVLCGRNAVQLSYPGREAIERSTLARKLEGVGRVTHNRFLLRFEVDNYAITVFPDGRSIIGGTDDITEARTAHSKYIGG